MDVTVNQLNECERIARACGASEVELVSTNLRTVGGSTVGMVLYEPNATLSREFMVVASGRATELTEVEGLVACTDQDGRPGDQRIREEVNA